MQDKPEHGFTERLPQKGLMSIVVAGMFAVDPLEAVLKFWIEKLSLPAQAILAPYNQVFQELLDPTSQFHRNTKGVNIVLLRIQDWHPKSLRSQNRLDVFVPDESAIRENTTAFIQALRSSVPQLKVPLFVILCPPSGHLTSLSDQKRFFQEMEHLIEQEAMAISGVDVLSWQAFLDLYPISDYEDTESEKIAHIPYIPVFYSVLGTVIARKIHEFLSPPCKIIFVDADHTLWNGVCGEDGPQGIWIDKSHREFQEYLVQQTRVGRLVCIVSRNNEDDIQQVFDIRTDMTLRLEHVTAICANWGPKSENIRQLAQALNLGLDSAIFLDDDPVECAEVMANCPQVLTFQLPGDPVDRMPFLKHLWSLDSSRSSHVGPIRTHLYHQQVQREKFRQQAPTLQDFIDGLNLSVQVSPMSHKDFERVSELTHRTNQFNCTTRRRTVKDLRQALLSQGLSGVVVSVRDRFGDYGLVGVMLYIPLDDTLLVDSLLLSCRALGRGVEHHMVAFLGHQAEKLELNTITLPFIPTTKNQPAWNFLQSIASDYHHLQGQESVFVLPASIASTVSYQPTSIHPQTGSPASHQKTPFETDNAQANRERAEQLLSIALSLGSPERIHEAVTSTNLLERDLETPFVGPRTELEQRISNICTEVFGINQLGVNDNFFNLGVHSLLLVQISNRIKAQLDLELPIHSFFLAPTVAGITQALLRRSSDEAMNLPSSNRLSEEIAQFSPKDVTSPSSDFVSLYFENQEASAPTPSSSSFNSDLSSSPIQRHRTEQYRLSNISRIPNGLNEELLYAPTSRRSIRVPSSFAEVLSRQKRFCTREELTEKVLNVPKNEVGRNLVQTLLDQLIETNLLISESTFIESWSSKLPFLTPSCEDLGVTTLGMPTGNRPQALQRSFESYLQNCSSINNVTNILIIDDSQDSQVNLEYRERLKTLQCNSHLSLRYAGPQELQKFLLDLHDQGDIPRSVIEFALMKPSHLPGLHSSGNRNALLLATVGELMFSADDDTLCQAVESPVMSKGLGLTSDSDASEYWFFPTRDSLLRELSLQPFDALREVQKLLGKSPAQILYDMGGKAEDITTHTINDEFLRRLTDPQARVTLAFPGLVGDCGWGAPFGFWGAPMGFLLMEGATHSRLTQTDQHYHQSCTSREILRVTPTPILSDASFSMATFWGMDNRELLPPFFPIGRGSDVVFGWTTWHGIHHSLFGHIPWAMLHAPQNPREFHQGEMSRTASAFDIGKVLFTCFEMFQWNSHQGDSGQWLMTLGNFLKDISQLSPVQFDEFMRVGALRYNSRFERMMEKRLADSHAMPKYWAQDLEQYLTLLRKSELRRDYWVPLDIAMGSSLATAKKLTPKTLSQFGELLCWWPAIRDAAHTLKIQGQLLGIPL